MRLRVIVLSLLPGLTGCSHFFANQEAAPVVSIDARRPITKGHHTVQAGETLYAIAWEYGHDYRELAATNHIAPPHRIYPGQKLALKGQFTLAKRTSKPKSVPTTRVVTIPKVDNKTEIAQFTVKPAQPVILEGAWSWPAKGKVIKGFSTKEYAFNKGVDIAGTLGDPVLSAKAGKVVYSGAGLRGYGQLIIIKHNDTFLSAYGHNRRSLVKEGETIEQGQKIAEMGQSDTDRVKLHFEIRKNGQPVNPIHFLPKTAV